MGRRPAVGTARLLSDGVCNAYLVDVWTRSSHRRRGVASAMVRDLMVRVGGQHIALQTDDAQAFYVSLGFRPQPELYSIVVGTWLDNDANRHADDGDPDRGSDLPGREFSCDGVERDNVHVAVQVGKEPDDLARADAADAVWTVDVRTVAVPDGFDLRGPAIHGRRGERFLYLTWGQVGTDGRFEMFRRAKLMVADIDPDLLRTASEPGAAGSPPGCNSATRRVIPAAHGSRRPPWCGGRRRRLAVGGGRQAGPRRALRARRG